MITSELVFHNEALLLTNIKLYRILFFYDHVKVDL